jgi:hypothetical protein
MITKKQYNAAVAIIGQYNKECLKRETRKIYTESRLREKEWINDSDPEQAYEMDNQRDCCTMRG